MFHLNQYYTCPSDHLLLILNKTHIARKIPSKMTLQKYNTCISDTEGKLLGESWGKWMVHQINVSWDENKREKKTLQALSWLSMFSPLALLLEEYPSLATICLCVILMNGSHFMPQMGVLQGPSNTYISISLLLTGLPSRTLSNGLPRKIHTFPKRGSQWEKRRTD